MLDVLILFPASAGTADVDAVVAAVVPSLSGVQGLRSIRVSTGDLMRRGGPSGYSRVIELSFDSLGDWMAWALAPERQDSTAAFDRLQPDVLFFDAVDPRAGG